MPLSLTTPRLVIEPLATADVPAFVAYRQDPDVARWQSWNTDYSEEDGFALVRSQPVRELPDPGDWLQLAVRDRSGAPLFGDVAVHRLAEQPDTYEIGMTLAPQFQHRGIAHEAVARVLDHLFAEADAHRVIAECDARNAPVARLLRGLGLRQESHQVEADWFKQEWTTVDGYAVLAAEHAAHAAGRITIRSARPDDAGAVAEVYLAAVRSELPYLRLAHTDDEVREWYRDVVLPLSRVVVAVRGGEVVGFGAHHDGRLDHLYVRPDVLRQGIGAALMRQIKTESPDGLALFVFQRNWAARAFYRRHGFVATAFTSGALNEEHEPDLVMRWTP